MICFVSWEAPSIRAIRRKAALLTPICFAQERISSLTGINKVTWTLPYVPLLLMISLSLIIFCFLSTQPFEFYTAALLVKSPGWRRFAHRLDNEPRRPCNSGFARVVGEGIVVKNSLLPVYLCYLLSAKCDTRK